MAVIWFNPGIQVSDLLPLGKGTMGEHLGIEWEELGPDFIKASMPVDHRTKQPYGLLHGGASVALAETLGSVGAALTVDSAKFIAVGMEINANHIRSARQGRVVGITRPIHRGASTQVWEIRIEDEQGKLICISRLTVAIRKI
ncbi:hotdog fold thioesterase [Flavihumibacter sp. CACIAM 22H1]|uniref:hotdog fold thioesterase n=1 Tax=Flavihumibacter sp. CACIAM 22H1 TaxID=1812911 RepID=UPI0007A80C27|nr:hotdog fold thioesterase [Flavihumibacter sp. CACIAM 22H1]KYP14252.1 MAG: thioesterase [Flavihumibacter sp. CACIAM 22H1]